MFSDIMTDFWDNRYKASVFAYGKSPNLYLKQCIESYDLSGSIILPAEGEGRNAVYAAQKGLNVFAFDNSVEGQKKATQLAQECDVRIRYDVLDWADMPTQDTDFDCAAMIFAHIPLSIQRQCHQKIADSIRVGGTLLFEGFSTNHLEYRAQNPKVGGPGKLEMLFAKDDIASDFSNFDIVEFEEVEVNLQEGSFHQGVGKVIRFIGKKR